MHEIFLKAESVFHIGSFTITNALLLSGIVVLFLILIAVLLERRLQLVPDGLQSIAEIAYEQLLDLMDSVLGERRKSEKYLPFIATLFLFILFSNWFGILPGVGSVGFFKEKPVAYTEIIKGEDHDTVSANTEIHAEKAETHTSFTPLFRAPSSDLNFTLALAILTVLMVNIFGIVAIGAKTHIGKFINFKSPISFFIGILELISEIARMISFAFRLFGNVFAGEVLLVVIAFLVPVFVPVPFFFLEIFVGFIQAFVFAMLALVFIAMSTTVMEH